MAELNARIIPKASGTAGEVPLASDLETAELAVNTADGTLFTKDVGGAVVAISGAVDSVNSETGVVSLGIQNMDDFSLNPISGVYEWPNKANSGDTFNDRSCPNPGDWAGYSVEGTTFIYLYNDSISQQLLVSGTVTLTLGTGESFTGVVTTNTTTQSSWAIGFSSSSEVDSIADAALGVSLTIESSMLVTGDAPLVEGDILQWNNTGQKFKPVEHFNVKAASYSDLEGGQSVDSTTATAITGCTNVVTENSIYSNTAGVITISEAGVYEIYGCVGATGNTADYRWTAEYDVRVDGSMVARQVGGYIRATSASFYSDIAINTIVPITAGQTVDFTLRRVSNVTGNATVLANTSRILIKKLS